MIQQVSLSEFLDKYGYAFLTQTRTHVHEAIKAHEDVSILVGPVNPETFLFAEPTDEMVLVMVWDHPDHLQ